MHSFWPAFVLLSLGAGMQAAPLPPDSGVEDIVVTARRDRPLPPLLDAVDYYRDHCFEPNRLTGRSAPPPEDGDWQPLGADARRRFGLTDAASPAFGLTDPARGRTLLLKFERAPQPGGLVESRCTLVLIGGDEHAGLPGQVAALFHGAGTQRHVGALDGVPRLPGWRQYLWTAMPERGSRRWRVVPAGRGGPTYVVVADPIFYDRYDYVLGDLKVRETGGRPLSVVSFAYTTRTAGGAVR